VPSSADERADACVQALPGAVPATWDIDGARTIATGSQQQPGGAGRLARLRVLANLTAPEVAEVADAVAALRAAAARIAGLAGSAAERARDLAALLDAALGHHRAHGDGPCPVCGSSGALTPAWRAATEQHRDRLRAEASAVDEATAAATAAVTRSHALVRPIPQQLAAVSSGDPATAAVAAEAWRSWAAVPEAAGDTLTAEGLTALASHLEGAHGPLTTAVTALAGQAAAELASRDDQWSPLAAELASWCDHAAAARAGARPVAALKAARQWLVSATAEHPGDRDSNPPAGAAVAPLPAVPRLARLPLAGGRPADLLVPAGSRHGGRHAVRRRQGEARRRVLRRCRSPCRPDDRPVEARDSLRGEP
jgi:hypothetical protein